MPAAATRRKLQARLDSLVRILLRPGFSVLLLLAAAAVSAADDATTRVAVASSLRHVWPQLIEIHPHSAVLKTTFGSSGNLSRQILQGAPFCVFLSADAEYVERLRERGRLVSEPIKFATGALALVARPGSIIATAMRSDDWQTVLRDRQWSERLAVANPRHAPYGAAAQQVLDAIGAPATLRPLQAENAAQALQFLLSGGADAALVPQALTQAATAVGNWVVADVDSRLHEPVVHMAALVRPLQPSNTDPADADSPARQLLALLISPKAAAILSAGGFDPYP